MANWYCFLVLSHDVRELASVLCIWSRSFAAPRRTRFERTDRHVITSMISSVLPGPSPGLRLPPRPRTDRGTPSGPGAVPRRDRMSAFKDSKETFAAISAGHCGAQLAFSSSSPRFPTQGPHPHPPKASARPTKRGVLGILAQGQRPIAARNLWNGECSAEHVGRVAVPPRTEMNQGPMDTLCIGAPLLQIASRRRRSAERANETLARNSSKTGYPTGNIVLMHSPSNFSNRQYRNIHVGIGPGPTGLLRYATRPERGR